MKTLFKAMSDRLKQGEPLVLCTIIASSGSTPRGKGAKMAVFSDGITMGTIGGGAVEYETIKLAQQAIKEEKAVVKSYNLTKNETADIGMICGGQVVVYLQYIKAHDFNAINLLDYALKLYERDCDSWLITCLSENNDLPFNLFEQGKGFLFKGGISLEALNSFLGAEGTLTENNQSYYVEPLTESGVVYVFGGGHVSQELVPLLTRLGFKVVVYEDRASFTGPDLFPDAYESIVAPFDVVDKMLTLSESDYAVIMTRGHQADLQVLEQVIRSPLSYIGVIGSKHKKVHTLETLKAAGISEEAFKVVHSPIGLPIKGQTPIEIAVSIAGELILQRAEKKERKIYEALSDRG